MLSNSWVKDKALASENILKNVVEHKKAFFNAKYANYDDCLNRKFRLIPTEPYLKKLEQDFTQMVAAGMFHELPPTFDKIVEDIRRLEETINNTDFQIS